ncbi:MAG: hypothetical protein ACE14T_02140 [Syntrophales bacterium]
MAGRVAVAFICFVFWVSVGAASASALTVDPGEIDFGMLRPGVVYRGIVSLAASGPGGLEWSLRGPEGWFSPDIGADSVFKGNSEEILVAVETWEAFRDPLQGGKVSYPVQIKLQVKSHPIVYRRMLPFGKYRELLKIESGAEMHVVSLKFEVAENEGPRISVEPAGIDFGEVESDRTLAARIKIRNTGKRILHWKAVIPAGVGEKAKFTSFKNEQSRGKGNYAAPLKHGKGFLLAGTWSEYEGYPVGSGNKDILTYGFSGSGIAILYWKDYNAGNLSVFLDDELVDRIDCYSPVRERAEFIAAQGLADAPHTLKLVADRRPVMIEGVRIYSKEIMHGPPGWVRVLPDTGNSAGQTNYVTVNVCTAKLMPGQYVEQIAIESDGGREIFEISLLVTAGRGERTFIIYKYMRGYDCLYTGNPGLEDKNLLKLYKKQGVAFRLFREDTPGTRKLFRWYHPARGDHFYSYDRSGSEKLLSGYIFEGTIGNIATSRLPGTRELYRWYNRSTGRHYYTTDSKGGGVDRKGYRFDAIVGFVR